MPAGAPEGNRNAVKGRDFNLALRKALAHKSKSSYSAGLEAVAKQLVNAAYEGEQWAIKEIADRTEGKAPQAINVGGQEGNPIQVTEVKITALTSDD